MGAERAPETVTGVVERIVYRNADDGWSVLRLRVKGRRRLVTIVGHSFSVAPGETLEASGAWTEHADHGERFAAEALKITLPQTAAAAEKYLGSGLIKGVGPELARRLVERFGGASLEVIENDPERLREVSGLGPARASAIADAWREQKAMRELMDFLAAHGLSGTFAPRISNLLGPHALDFIRKNPYRLAREVLGIGFQSADKIARHLKLPSENDERFAAALHDRLWANVSRGHCAVPPSILLSEASREVGYPVERLKPVLEDEIESGRLLEENLDDERGVGIFPLSLARAEERVARQLMRLAHGRPPWLMTEVNARLSAVAQDLSDEHRRALQRLVRSKLSLLTGGPGTGKTTLVRSLRAIFPWGQARVECVAPTGRAAQRLSESTGEEAQTIHRLLGWEPEEGGFRYRAGKPLALDLLIIDEMSMVGVELFADLLEALPDHAAVVLVGDPQQLPSVQAGRVLESVLGSHVFNQVSLNKIYRQKDGRESGIVRASHEVIEGRRPQLKNESDADFHFIEVASAEACTRMILKLVAERIPRRFGFDAMTDVQVICPMNKGEVGARQLNRRLQAVLNPNASRTVERFGRTYALGDKVIALENNYEKEVFNGDVGRVIAIEPDLQTVRLDFGRGRQVEFEFAELEAFALGFAVSVHKAQGSEYPAVIVPLWPESSALLDRRLLYTAITRGKKLVVLVGHREGLRLGLRAQAQGSQERWTGLKRRLLESQRRESHQFAAGFGSDMGATGSSTDLV